MEGEEREEEREGEGDRGRKREGEGGREGESSYQPRVVFHTATHGTHRELTVLQRQPSPCREELL